MSHFDLKNPVCDGTKIRPNFLGQNESLGELKFDPTFYVKMTQLFSQCTERKNVVILT